MPSETLIRPDLPGDQNKITAAIEHAAAALARHQQGDGHWVFELEADATIPSEYVLLEHYMGRIDAPLEAKIGVYLRGLQNADGGWPLFHEGASDLSVSVKAYFALKAIGDQADAPHMARARRMILAAGGAERANVFARIQLALFGQVPWRAVPVMPVQIMHLPRWFFFHLSKVSYWSRTVTVPLLVLMALRPKARNPHGVSIAELFRTPPAEVRDWLRGPYRSAWGHVFRLVDTIMRPIEPRLPRRGRERAIAAAVRFVSERMNGEDGLGAIYPAMANTVMMFDALGFDAGSDEAMLAWRAVRKLLIVRDDRAYCQPCLSPIWDTALASHAMAEALGPTAPCIDAASAWLVSHQITGLRGDWAAGRPDAPPGGWAFQYQNAHYPDVDDTAAVALLLHRTGDPANAASVEQACAWVLGMQGRDGGWGAFDADNNHDFLNHIPFADHGALLDPSTADVTARCVALLTQVGHDARSPAVARAIAYLRAEQEDDGSWFGRWGTNYIYGTWSVLCALNMAGLSHQDPAIARGAAFLLGCQRDDGGWGEDEETYAGAPPGRHRRSTPSQTAWALVGLMAAGLVEHEACERGIEYLVRTQQADGEWAETEFTAVGFPRVFYLRYHGYRLFFPLLALARYRTLTQAGISRVTTGF